MTQLPADGDNLRERLRRALPAAMKARDRPAVNALRSALAAIDNAGAVDPAQAAPGTTHPAPAATDATDPEPAGTGDGDPKVAGSVAGLGAAEVERRSLSEAQMEELVRAEALDRERAAAGYERTGQLELAERLRGEATVLRAYLDTT
ncbi:MAG TPA: hypothetical protein VLA80_11780 [Actinomycetota bacterium]|nr:hypothetical protein [Actinomycetota bacterium]